MARRMLAWLLVTPLAAAGILAAHALAYLLTGTTLGPSHDYLAHAPQVVVVLATIGVVGLALQERSLSPRSWWWFAPLAPLGFICQEHLERLVHTGHVPWLLTTPVFLLGLLLQVPVAVVCVVLASRIAGWLARGRSDRGLRPGEAWLPLPARTEPARTPADPRRRSGRGPPALLAS
ncbi:MAG: hypothetical protein M5U27_03580 [Gaiella sp.]|nr:hypothetical protein [Gaiella sp.]